MNGKALCGRMNNFEKERMMKTLLSLLLSLLCAAQLFAQQRYIVYFKDKGAAGAGAQDWYDLPVQPRDLQPLAAKGKIIAVSKWLNACIVEMNGTDAASFRHEGISRVEPVAERVQRASFNLRETSPFSFLRYKKTDTAMYGLNVKPITNVGADCLHAKGLKGEGVKIAFLDAGFKGLDTISAFDKIRAEQRLLYTRDLWSNSANVYHGTTHGMSCFGYVGAEKENVFVGAAPHASFMLFLTDDYNTETRQDEFNYARALEMADSMGAQVVSASISYKDFDPGQGNYAYTDMNGQTAISTKAADIAASKGMIIVGSAGNSGYLCAPCDAKNALCVGGANYGGAYDQISSYGPSYDGRVKPDVVGMTINVYGIYGDGSILVQPYGGTSSACPQVAGIAALLRQAHPQHSNLQIIDAIRKSASHYQAPDNNTGYGVPNGCKADSILNTMLPTGIGQTITHSSPAKLELYPNPAHNVVKLHAETMPIRSVQLLSADGRLVQDHAFVNSSFFELDLSQLESGCYFVKTILSDGTGQRTRLVRY